MGLNNIELSPLLLAELYPSTLIETISETSKAPAIKFLGKNQKNILILVSKKETAFLEDEELEFLSTVLAACKLSIADIAIVNIQNLSSTTLYKDLITYFNSYVVLLFNVAPDQIDLPFKFPHFQLQKFDQQTYLSAPDLKEIENEKSLKAKLWNCLKNLFGL